MSALTALPGLPPEAIQQLASCGIDSMEMLAGIPPAEIHRVLELTAWQKGNLGRAPTLDMVHHWAKTARQRVGSVGLAQVMDEIPETPALPPPAPVPRRGYVPPSQRARLSAAGPPVPAAPLTGLLTEDIKEAIVIPAALPAPRHAVPITEPVPSGSESAGGIPGFNSFEDYQAGQNRITPLSRYSIDTPGEHPPMERINANEEVSRMVRRGVVHPNPSLLIFGALISLVWRLVLLAAVLSVPWLVLMVPRPSEYLYEILIAAGVLLVLGIMQLVVMGRARCRICSCHLFYSKNCVKNRKAHSLPLIGKTASLSLHLLLFQWFRCMYCGTAIKLWATKTEESSPPA